MAKHFGELMMLDDDVHVVKTLFCEKALALQRVTYIFYVNHIALAYLTGLIGLHTLHTQPLTEPVAVNKELGYTELPCKILNLETDVKKLREYATPYRSYRTSYVAYPTAHGASCCQPRYRTE